MMTPERARLWCFLLPQNLEIKNFVFLTEEELLLVLSWRNHPEISRFMFRRDPISWEEHLTFVSELRRARDRFYYLVVFEEPIGVIYLSGVEWRKGQAELGLYRRPDRRRLGILLMKALEFLAFSVLGLSELLARVLPGNEKAINLYHHFGYEFRGKSKDFLVFGKKIQRTITTF